MHMSTAATILDACYANRPRRFLKTRNFSRLIVCICRAMRTMKTPKTTETELYLILYITTYLVTVLHRLLADEFIISYLYPYRFHDHFESLYISISLLPDTQVLSLILQFCISHLYNVATLHLSDLLNAYYLPSIQL